MRYTLRTSLPDAGTRTGPVRHHCLPRASSRGRERQSGRRRPAACGRSATARNLGLVLNCVVLWTTVYLDAAVRCQLKAQGYPVREEDMARLSPFVNTHLGVHGTYSFVLPDLGPGAIR